MQAAQKQEKEKYEFKTNKSINSYAIKIYTKNVNID